MCRSGDGVIGSKAPATRHVTQAGKSRGFDGIELRRGEAVLSREGRWECFGKGDWGSDLLVDLAAGYGL